MQTQTLRIIVFLLLTLVAMLYFYTSQQKTHYQRTAITAINQILTEISGWEKQALLRNLSPEAQKTVNEMQLDELLNLYRHFGRYRSLDELAFSKVVSAFSLIGEKRINYSGTVNFDAGLVNLNITLVERGGYYLIYNFTLTKAVDG
ncbi:MAG: hypothetical protein Q8K59_01660 [Nitrosomonas sp.]|nr:hypothetical protein [Nitrosomonas sp.]MDP1949808.1 hypothetical protein [Nitrosomonas sp.]